MVGADESMMLGQKVALGRPYDMGECSVADMVEAMKASSIYEA